MENAVDDDGRNRHGFPRGYHFVPHDLELMRLLDEQLAGRRLPYPLPNIFHHVRIRDFHPAHLYEEYREHEEAGYIYFFDHREYRTAGWRPARATMDGGWKASGGGKAVRRGGVVLGYKLTMVFYQKEEDPRKPDRKTEWALNEYTRIVGPDDDKVESLALYRLYKKRAGWVTPATVLAGWDNMPPWMAPSLPPPIPPSTVSAVAHNLPVSGHSNSEPPLPLLPLPAPVQASEGYLADEFKAWCETKQEDPQAASPCWLPYDDMHPDLPTLMDESELYSCTLEELLLAPNARRRGGTSNVDAGRQPGRHSGTSSDVDARRQPSGLI